MIYMLDTNILIYLIKNKPPSIAARVNELDTDAVLCMSFISYAEFLKDAEKGIRKAETLQQLNRLTQQITINFKSQPISASTTRANLPCLKKQALR